jgi:glycosyltransferase involved in cell wall biosynthesis
MLLRFPKGMRAPLVYESHGYSPDVADALPSLLTTAAPPSESKRRRLENREAHVWRAADGYVTITKGLADELSHRFGPRSMLAIVPDGVRAPAAQSRTSSPDGAISGSARPVIAYAGHLYPWKGVDVLLDAIASLPEVDGLIVGGHDREPDLARLKARADALKVADRVVFTGIVPPPSVAQLLDRATVLVLPNPASAISMRFTSPLKLFEYMAAGRPIVASDLPAIREVLRPDEHAVLVAPGRADALAAGIRRVIGDPALAARLASAARAAVVDYTWDRRAARLEALLQQATGVRA